MKKKYTMTAGQNKALIFNFFLKNKLFLSDPITINKSQSNCGNIYFNYL